MGLLIRIALVLAGGAAAAVLWTAGAPGHEAAPTHADALAAKLRLESWIREQASAVRVRAVTLAQVPRVEIAVTTDADTVADLLANELDFKPFPNETVEVVQRHGDRTTRLLRIPARAELPVDFSRETFAIAVQGDAVVITQAVPIGKAGALAVSWRFPASALADRGLVDGSLVVGTATLQLGAGAPDNARLASLSLDLADPATYIAALGADGAPASWPLRGGGLALALAATITAVCARRRRRDEPITAGTSARMGRYEQLGLVDAREVSNVYLARATGEHGFERRVTLDVVHPPLARDPALVRALLDHARSAAKISHPNLVEILDLGFTGDDCFIATEYVEGGDLARLLDHLRMAGRTMPVAVALAIARRLCDGLQAVHAGGVVHRDVRPTHVYLARSGAVKLGGFGLSRKQTHGAADPRVDVFGIGAVLYELVTLATFDPFVQPSQLRADLPAELDAVIVRAIAFSATERPATCVELEAELARIVHANALDVTDREIAHWLATETFALSPTLRGWPALDAN